MILPLFFSLIQLSAASEHYALSTAADIFEKSFTRDNSYCTVGQQRVEFNIRGDNQYTHRKDRGYGEHVLIKIDGQRHILDVHNGHSGLYKFFEGKSSLCSKSVGHNLDDATFALIFQKANRPHEDKLVIQLMDTQKVKPLKVIHTEFLADKILLIPGGFYFRNNAERVEIDMGSITRDNQKFIYQDRDFQKWYHFSRKGIELREDVTYKHFSFKDHFLNPKDFFQASGWVEKHKTFTNRFLYVAVNHELKQECVIFLPEPRKLTGTEAGWRCRQR